MRSLRQRRNHSDQAEAVGLVGSKGGATTAFRRYAALLAASLSAGALAGVCGAGFLYALAAATSTRGDHLWLVYCLPLAGFAAGLTLARVPSQLRSGGDAVIHATRGSTALPWWFAPLATVGTVFTHLFGGSAGREGSAVQLGGGVADIVGRVSNVAGALRAHLLVAGVAGGFAAVFATPCAAAIFAIEWLVAGQLALRSLPWAVTGSASGYLVAEQVGEWLNVKHSVFPLLPPLPIDPSSAGQLTLFAAVIAIVAVCYLDLIHATKRAAAQYLPAMPLRLASGGIVVVALWLACDSNVYLGLGVPTIESAVAGGEIASYDFVLKLVFTIATVGVGFIGGEVTPLFFVGATMGNSFASALDAPKQQFAAIGMVALYGAAANVPLAMTAMAAELFGPALALPVVIVALFAGALTQQRSIHFAQIATIDKSGGIAVNGH